MAGTRALALGAFLIAVALSAAHWLLWPAALGWPEAPGADAGPLLLRVGGRPAAAARRVGVRWSRECERRAAVEAAADAAWPYSLLLGPGGGPPFVDLGGVGAATADAGGVDHELLLVAAAVQGAAAGPLELVTDCGARRATLRVPCAAPAGPALAAQRAAVAAAVEELWPASGGGRGGAWIEPSPSVELVITVVGAAASVRDDVASDVVPLVASAVSLALEPVATVRVVLAHEPAPPRRAADRGAQGRADAVRGARWAGNSSRTHTGASQFHAVLDFSGGGAGGPEAGGPGSEAVLRVPRWGVVIELSAAWEPRAVGTAVVREALCALVGCGRAKGAVQEPACLVTFGSADGGMACVRDAVAGDWGPRLAARAAALVRRMLAVTAPCSWAELAAERAVGIAAALDEAWLTGAAADARAALGRPDTCPRAPTPPSVRLALVASLGALQAFARIADGGGDVVSVAVAARRAVECATAAAFDGAMAPVPHFPDEYLWAVYLPLLVPSALPIAIAVVAEGKRWFRRRAHTQ